MDARGTHTSADRGGQPPTCVRAADVPDPWPPLPPLFAIPAHAAPTPTSPPPHTNHRPPATTRVARNPNFGKLQAGYLFPEIARRRRAHAEARPDARIISLGIGDTTEPIPPTMAKAMADAAAGLGTLDGYSG